MNPRAINPVSGTPGVVTFAGVNGTPERAFATDFNNFGPRLGFAYRLAGQRETVVRGGAIESDAGVAAALAAGVKTIVARHPLPVLLAAIHGAAG